MVADWQGMLIILAVTSMAVGNIAAIAQTNIKRMLAYSTISHMGFVLLGVLAGDENGYSSAMFYVRSLRPDDPGYFGMIMLLSRAALKPTSSTTSRVLTAAAHGMRSSLSC
jgi:NADH-quinone oxidoreductase subunit N